MNKSCSNCSKEFRVAPSRRLQKFCSSKCYGVSKKGLQCSPATQFKKGSKPPHTGKKLLKIQRENHWNWKGGKHLTPAGYVRIKQSDHPFADPRGYIFEHRLVMERTIGRLLTVEEVVHHRDHNRANNDPSNLMLFASDKDHQEYANHRWGKEVR